MSSESTGERYHPTPGTLARLAANAYLVARGDVLGPSRRKQACRARQLLMMLLHEHCSWSISLIGRKLGRDHATVSWGIRRYGGRLIEDEEDQKAYDYVQRELARLAQEWSAAQKQSIPRRKGSEVIGEGRRVAG